MAQAVEEKVEHAVEAVTGHPQQHQHQHKAQEAEAEAAGAGAVIKEKVEQVSDWAGRLSEASCLGRPNYCSYIDGNVDSP